MDTPQDVIDAYLERVGAVWGRYRSRYFHRSPEVSKRVAYGRYGERDDKARFWKKVAKGDQEECWHWEASKDSSGYGIFKIGQTNVRAHRYSYLIHKGNILNGQQVCHTCDNPSCVNPRHLFVGTMIDNQIDKIQKGRQYKPPSEGNLSLITQGTADAIRAAYQPRRGPRPNYGEIKRLSELFGLTRKVIADVVAGKTWKNKSK